MGRFKVEKEWRTGYKSRFTLECLIPLCSQVVWVNYQIMTTVAWNVRIKWPAPFATFERLLSILDLSLLRLMPVACIVPCAFPVSSQRDPH